MVWNLTVRIYKFVQIYQDVSFLSHQAELATEQKHNQEAAQSSDYYLDRIEELTHNLSQAEKKLKAFEEEKAQQQEKVDKLYR